MKRSTALLLITLLSTGVVIADTAATESEALDDAAALEKNAGDQKASGEQLTDKPTIPETTPVYVPLPPQEEVKPQPKEKNAALRMLEAAGSFVPKNTREGCAMVAGAAVGGFIVWVLYQKITVNK